MSAPFISAALKVAQDYKVFPTIGKAPAWSNDDLVEMGLITKGQAQSAKGGYHVATKYTKDVKRLFTKGKFIGVPCRPNGLLVVDVDLYKPGAKEWHEANREWLEKTLCHSTPGGGLHYIFQDPGGKIPGELAPGVDLKCNGYVNWPGAGGYKALNQKSIKSFTQDLNPTTSLRGPSGSYSDGLSNDELVQQVIKAESFHPALRTLSARLASYSHCTADEIEEKLTALMDESEAKSIQHPDHDRWVDRRSKIPDLAQSAVAKFDPIPPGVEVIDATHMLGNGVDHDPPEYEEPEAVEVAPTAPSAPPGLVGQVMAFSQSCARYQTPVADLVAGLVTISTLSSNRAVLEYEGKITSLNLYTLLVGPSGSGKENPRRVLQRLITAMKDLAPVAYWSSLPSYIGMYRGMLEIESRAAVLAMDEAGKFLRTAGGTGSSHNFELMTEIMKLYGLSQDTVPARPYADKKNNLIPIIKPYLNMLGTTTSEALIPALRSEDVVNGMLNRFLIFDMPYGDRDRTGTDDIPKQLLKDLSAWLQALKADTKIKVLKPAMKRMIAWDDEVETHKRTGDPLWQRTFENTLKLAAIVAAGDGGTMKLEHVSWAIECAVWCQHNLEVRVAGMIVAEGQLEVQNKIRAAISKKGPMSKRQLQRLCHREGSKLYNEAYNTLRDAGMLVEDGKVGKAQLYNIR